MKSRIVCVVGARPNFMKIAPLMRAFHERAPSMVVTLVHTGQHYDVQMNNQFFEQLDISRPDVSLEVGSGTHAVQTANIMKRFEPILDEVGPDAVLVVGDVNSTVACALVAAKKGIRVIHVEAGLRSRDRTMPEEINRILTDQLSDRLYVTEFDAIRNLESEGICCQKVVFAGNVMIDNLLHSLPKAIPPAVTIAEHCSGKLRAWAERNDLAFGVVTLHRPSNVDDRMRLISLLDVLDEVSKAIPLVFPLHPRTRSRMLEFGVDPETLGEGIFVLPPIGFLEMLGLLSQARLIMTDSGGLQEEATALGVQCLTLRDSTERPITVSHGTNVLTGSDPVVIRREVARVLSSRARKIRRPEMWDGRAAHRIVDDIGIWLAGEKQQAQPTTVAG